MKKAVILCISLFCAQAVWAGDTGLVIKVKGIAEIQSHNTQQAVQIKRGQKIQIGDKIKTANKTKLHILNADGSILRVKGSKEFIYKGSKKDSPTTAGWTLALMELKNKRSKKAIAMTRGVGEKTPDQEIWMNLMQHPLTENDAEDVLILASWYGGKHQYNRQSALLWKLGNDLSDERLKKQATQEYSNQFQWRVNKHIQKHWSEAMFEDSLTAGDQLQVLFTPKKESYYYLFFTTQPLEGSIKTYPLYPSGLESTKIEHAVKYYEARVKSGVEYKTPKFTLDHVIAYEHLWGWSCSGPILNASITQQAINAVRQHLSTFKSLTSKELAKNTPAICTPFSLSLKHR